MAVMDLRAKWISPFPPMGLSRSACGIVWPAILAVLALATAPSSLHAQEEDAQVIDLTLETMVTLALSSSYQIRRLNLDIQRDRYNLEAQQARLKSSVDLDVTVPAFRLTSEPRWNSDLQKDEIVRENTRRWEGEVSIRQPVVLLGYPTNGYLSFNNRLYRYNQISSAGEADVSYYNRYYVRYTQPIFQPNRLKNDLEQAELSLEGTQLEFHGDVIEIVDDLSGDYFHLFEDAYRGKIHHDFVAALERAVETAERLARADSSRAIEVNQIQVELANAREQVQQSESAFRLRSSWIKQRLGLEETDSITLEPVFFLDPVEIDVEEAISFAMELTPRMRQLDISLRNSEIRLEETKGRGGFRMDLSMSYGRERRDELFDHIFVDPDNSYTIDVEAYIPIWDWGERKARIASSRLGVERNHLRIEEVERQIQASVRNEVLNVREYQNRTMAMEENLELARGVSEDSFRRYAAGSISALDLIQSLRREMDTANNFLDTYIGWRQALLSLQEMTYYDFERDLPVLDRFGVEGRLDENGLSRQTPNF